MLKIGIIGCGKIADQHAEQIQRIAGCEIVGVCDREELMARQMYERYSVRQWFVDVEKLLEIGCPDIVHITTPPQSHFALGKLCLKAGCHVYIEKPFTLDSAEAERLINLANENKLKLTVGHNAQFSHAAIRMRDLIGKGVLGGPPVHMESDYCYNLADQNYAKALLGDKQHWVRKLPGQLLHNIISHGISRIAEFWPDNTPHVVAHGFTSPLLRRIGETEIIDELRVLISDKQATTAYFTFSSQLNPPLRQFRIYGPENALLIDENHQTVIQIRGRQYKSYLNQFVPAYDLGKQYIGNLFHNIGKFARSEFHNDSGMKHLIAAFYRSVRDNSIVPISYGEILRTARIMDDTFEQLRSSRPAMRGENVECQTT
ncbi:MAG: Gfo/Idh/MocA family oxidoreductase [Nitrospira sp.]|nr:Gfo/Idh/MocA family oxidoreductase [Nitrospira sp.]